MSLVPPPLKGSVQVPGDKSIGHRSLLIGALCDGAVSVTGLGSGEDNIATQRALEQLGVRIEREGTSAVVHGVGLYGLTAPQRPIDCGNSGTTMRLLLGILAGQPFPATLLGDRSLSRRPMGRVLDPLSRMGLDVIQAQDGSRAPLTVQGRRELTALAYDSPIASAQVKSAVLLAGLWASGDTSVREPHPSRDHTERMLGYLGEPPQPRNLHVPGDLSSAAFVLGAAMMVPDSQVTVEQVGVNPTRTGFLEVVGMMGGRLTRTHEEERNGEPFADITLTHGPLNGTEIAGALTVRAIDELPLIATIASQAQGTTTIRDAGELRVKESDRIARTVAMLKSFGVPVDEHLDGLTIHGDPHRALDPGDVNARGDHRIAMCGLLLGMLAPGTRIQGAESVRSSFPGFISTLRSVGAALQDV